MVAQTLIHAKGSHQIYQDKFSEFLAHQVPLISDHLSTTTYTLHSILVCGLHQRGDRMLNSCL